MKNFVTPLLFALITISGIYPQTPSVEIKYQGHASFLIKFDNGRTILTDYGISDVYKEYGYESPIAKLNLVPDIVTYSHKHQDHYGGVFPDSGSIKLIGPETVELDWISITTLPAFEKSTSEPDNYSYLIKYRGIKVLHLGDVQALMLGCRNPEIIEKIKKIYNDKYDIVFLPVGFTKNIVADAVEFTKFISANVIVPMHYWKEEEKNNFIQLMIDKNSKASVKWKLEKAVSLDYSKSKYDNEVMILDIERQKEISNK